jgi:hypothetical protein
MLHSKLIGAVYNFMQDQRLTVSRIARADVSRALHAAIGILAPLTQSAAQASMSFVLASARSSKKTTTDRIGASIGRAPA